MKRTWTKSKISAVLTVACFCGIAQCQSDFSSDVNCIALWNYESGSLTTDSIGGNTLANTGVTANSAHQQGSWSAEFNGVQEDFFKVLDADLAADFPLKDAFDDPVFSMAFWVYFRAFDNADLNPANMIFQKYRYEWPADGAPRYSWIVSVPYDGGDPAKPFLFVEKGNGPLGAGTEGAWPISGGSVVYFATDRWYHVAITYDDSDPDSLNIRIWDETAGSIINTSNTATGAWTADMYVGTEPIHIGARELDTGAGYWYKWELDGYLDELVFFNDILTNDEIDQIRQGTYGAASGHPQMIPLQQDYFVHVQ